MSHTSELSLEQKASLASGSDFFGTQAVGSIPSIRTSDGPHGLRKQESGGDHLGIVKSVPATCYPPAAGLGQSWNEELVARVGAALGRECRAEDVQVLLGPGVNLKRSPLGGRSFEYFSEDPVLTAALGTAWVTGIQGEGVGSSPKHFVANEQETDRQRISSDVDPRPLREVYLRAFKRIVEDAKPWTVMASYNRLNGVYTAESSFLLTEVLRDEWGYDGVVVSDWGGITDRVASAAAGLDLEMPSSGGVGDRALVEAVRDGAIREELVGVIAERVAALAAKGAATPPSRYDVEDHHEIARDAAAQSIVLLKNDGDLLPLSTSAKIAVIGTSAQKPRYQGGGSSHTEPTILDIPLDQMRAIGDDVSFAPGHGTDPTQAERLRDEAVVLAAASDVAVVFLAVPEERESEGWDRPDIELPADQLELAAAVFEANPKTVAVVARGGIVRLAPLTQLPALLDGALLGQGGGHAIAATLFGVVNPSGHLTETIPERLEDVGSFLDFPGEKGHVRYSEGLFIGHRWFDARQLPVSFPFGHGLSYTTFRFDGLTLEETADGVRATVTVTNTGARAGRAVPQFYVSVPGSSVVRPVRELKAFASVEVEAGASVTVSALLRRDDLSYWDTTADRWVLEPGRYVVSVGASSRDLRGSADIEISGDVVRPVFTLESTLGELLADPAGAAVVGQMMTGMMAAAAGPDNAEAPPVDEDILKVMASFPLSRMISFSAGAATAAQLQQLVDAVNAA